MLKTLKNNISQILLVTLVILGIFGVAGTAPVTLAESADFEWQIVGSGGQPEIRVDAEEEGDYVYQWQVTDSNGASVIDRMSESGTLFLSNTNIDSGIIYDLNLTLRDGISNSVLYTNTEEVALPIITIRDRCIATFSGSNVRVTVDIVPDKNFFSGLGDPEVVLIENDRPKNPVSNLPHIYPVGQSGRTYQAEVAFRDGNIQLISDTITPICDDSEEEEVNFGYEVNDYKVQVTALSPLNENYIYAWDFDGGEIDDVGTTLSYTYPSDIDDPIVFVRLVVSQGGDIIGDTTKGFSISTNYKDSNGDGIPDHEETEEGVGGGSAAGDEEEDDEAEFTGDEQGLVNCTNNCGWAEFIELINKLITWLIGFATVVATLLFMYAGFLYLTAGADENQTKQAIGIFTNVAIGFGVILIAWLIVSAVVTLLTTEEWRNKNQPLIPVDISYELTEDRLQL